jgi:polyhydroxyalkanoate synthesis regulator phasin
MSFFNQNNTGNPMENMNFFNTWMSTQMNSAKQWMNQMQTGMNGNVMNEDFKNAYDNMMNTYNSWMSTMNTTYSEMLKNYGNPTTKDAFNGMFNNSEMYLKVFELWMPMLNSIKDKSFTPELFKKMFNTASYKEMMDKMFNMQPDFMKNLVNTDSVRENMAKMMGMNKEMYTNMKNMFSNNMPNSNELFTNMITGYNNMINQMNQSASPLMKMMSPGIAKSSMESMNDMASEFGNFQMKNTQMQYMMYTTGMEAMYEVAENIYNKIQNGEDMSNFMTIYSDFLNTNDKKFVDLFNTESYSKMQAEVNSLGMKMKRKMDLQMEKALTNVPVATRSEMDELYKTIYELKKRINSLEKQIDSDVVDSEEKESPKARKSAKNA